MKLSRINPTFFLKAFRKTQNPGLSLVSKYVPAIHLCIHAHVRSFNKHIRTTVTCQALCKELQIKRWARKRTQLPYSSVHNLLSETPDKNSVIQLCPLGESSRTNGTLCSWSLSPATYEAREAPRQYYVLAPYWPKELGFWNHPNPLCCQIFRAGSLTAEGWVLQSAAHGSRQLTPGTLWCLATNYSVGNASPWTLPDLGSVMS